MGDYPSADVDDLLEKYKRSKRLNYSASQEIKDFIYKMFELHKNKKLKNLKLDYSELRYKNLAKRLKRFIDR